MALDDEVEAIERQKQIEKYSHSIVTEGVFEVIARAASLLDSILPDKIPDPISSSIKCAVAYLSGMYRRRNQVYQDALIDAIKRKLARIERRQFELTPERVEYMKTQLMPLIIDGQRRAQQIRDEARIRRLAQILANTIEFLPSPDDSEEMMRIVMELSDSDVEFLRQMDRSPTRFRQGGPGIASIDEANDDWSKHRPHIEGLDRSDGQSIAAKLQSFGLIENVERRPNKVGPDETPFRMLRKGVQFIEFIPAYS